MAPPVNRWSKPELVAVLKLYCQTPFGKIHSRNPNIITLAGAIGRTPSAVALKMTNFASLDPTIERAGMSNHSHLDAEVWAEFFENMDAFLAQADVIEEPAIKGDTLSFPAGVDVERSVKVRLNQRFFRSMVVASYDGRCALTGLDMPSLLIASHIVPWVAIPEARTNPRNGICLNSLHDCAFDRGYISFTADMRVMYSDALTAKSKSVLSEAAQERLSLPTKFAPDPSFLEYHRNNVFRR